MVRQNLTAMWAVAAALQAACGGGAPHQAEQTPDYGVPATPRALEPAPAATPTPAAPAPAPPAPAPATAVRATTHAVTLSWTVPTVNTDGTALVDLVGWTVRYGTDATNLSTTKLINNASTTTLTIDGLAARTYYFEVRTRNAAGVESAPSAVVKVTLP